MCLQGHCMITWKQTNENHRMWDARSVFFCWRTCQLYPSKWADDFSTNPKTMEDPTLNVHFEDFFLLTVLYLDPYTLETKHVPWKNSGWNTTFLLKWLLFRGCSLVFGGVLLLIPVNPHNTRITFFVLPSEFFLSAYKSSLWFWMAGNEQTR